MKEEAAERLAVRQEGAERLNVAEEGAEPRRGVTSTKAGAASALEKEGATQTPNLVGEQRAAGRPLACPPCPRSPRGAVAAEDEPPLTCAAARLLWE